MTAHRCINQRMPTSGGLYVWDFARRGKTVNVRVDGPLVFNTSPPQVDAAVAGLGVALLPEDEVAVPLSDGRLLRVLQDWCPPFDGYHLHYPSRRQPSPAFSLVTRALRCDVRNQPSRPL
jgi:DNA-binding transcriptional LysR family regulator